MRLFTYAYSITELSRIEMLLHDKGIPTFSHSVKPARGCLPRWAIFVCLNQRFDDARRLLKNPDHSVAEPVNVSAYMTDLGNLDESLATKWATIILVAVAAFFSAVMYFFIILAPHGA